MGRRIPSEACTAIQLAEDLYPYNMENRPMFAESARVPATVIAAISPTSLLCDAIVAHFSIGPTPAAASMAL